MIQISVSLDKLKPGWPESTLTSDMLRLRTTAMNVQVKQVNGVLEGEKDVGHQRIYDGFSATRARF